MAQASSEPYTLEQAEEDIADLRGWIEILKETMILGDSSTTPEPPANNGLILYSLKSQPWYIGTEGLTLPLQAADVSTTNFTANTLNALAISDSWTIPPLEPNPLSAYRITATGTGTWGSTQQQLNVRLDLNGAGIGQNVGIAATTFAINKTIYFRTMFEIVFVTTGTDVTAEINSMTTVSGDSAANQAGTTVIRSGTGKFNTALAGGNVVSIQAYWSNGPSGSTITGNNSSFERLGR